MQDPVTWIAIHFHWGEIKAIFNFIKKGCYVIPNSKTLKHDIGFAIINMLSFLTKSSISRISEILICNFLNIYQRDTLPLLHLTLPWLEYNTHIFKGQRSIALIRQRISPKNFPFWYYYFIVTFPLKYRSCGSCSRYGEMSFASRVELALTLCHS